MSENIYYFNGQYYPKSQPVLHPFELGLLRGYGIFDYFKIVNDIPIFFEDHLERFTDSAEEMDLAIPIEWDETREVVHNLIEHNKLGYSGIRLVLTGGFADNGFTYEKPNIFILHAGLKENDPSLMQDGVRLKSVNYVREIPKVKTLNYSQVLKHQNILRKEKYFDVLFASNGIISEASRSNFFLIKGNKLITTDQDILFGITRKKVLELAVKNYEIEIRNIEYNELRDADEAFICGTTKPLVPIVEVDDIQIADGKPGSNTKALRELLHDFETQYIQDYNHSFFNAL